MAAKKHPKRKLGADLAGKFTGQDIHYLSVYVPGLMVGTRPDGESLHEPDPQQRKRTPDVLHFFTDKKDKDHVIAVQRGDATDEQLLALLTSFPKKYDLLRDRVLELLHLPQVTDEHHFLAGERKSRFEDLEEAAVARLRSTVRLPKPRYTELPLTPDNAINIPQGGAGITGVNGKAQYLATTGVAQCAAIIIKGPERIGLVHLDTSQNIDSLTEILNAVRGDSNNPLEVTLWGGRRDKSEQALATIVDFLETQPNLRIVAADLFASHMERHGGIAVSTKGELMVAPTEDMKKMTTFSTQRFAQLYKPKDYGKDALDPVWLDYIDESCRSALPPALKVSKKRTGHGGRGED